MLPDGFLIDKQCKSMDAYCRQLERDDPRRSVVNKGIDACKGYREEKLSRDDWVKAMFQLQDQIGRDTKIFVPEFSSALPANLDSF
jgi:hypothetical protein